MTIHDLPRWLLDWLLPTLPWLWVAVMTLGVVLIVSRWFRRTSKHPQCPACRYDMRGSSGLSCPECGHAVIEAEQLLRRPPRRRWVLWLGVLLVFSGPNIDLMQYRLLQGETIQRAAVPTTVWIVGYPWWPRAAEEVMYHRVLHETRRRGPASGFNHTPLPRSDILKYIFRQTEEVGYSNTPLPYWQTRLLARRSYASMRALQRKGLTTPYMHVVYFLMLSESTTDDSFARDKLVEGLGSNDPHIREGCLGAIKTLGVRASPYVPKLERRLRDLLIRGELDDADFRPRLYNNAELLYDEMVENLEITIGKAGPAGMVIANDWLRSSEAVLRDAAVRIVSHNTNVSLYTHELASRLVDVLVDHPRDQIHKVMGDAGLLAAVSAKPYLKSDSPSRRAEAVRVLGVVFFDGPERRVTSITRHRNRNRYYEEWAARVDDPVYQSVQRDITRMAADETDEIVLEWIELFLEKHRLLGTSDQRRNVIKMQDQDSANLMYGLFR